jgi:hypothetical protein
LVYGLRRGRESLAAPVADAVFGKARNGPRVMSRAKRDDERIGLEPIALDDGRARLRLDPVDLAPNDPNSSLNELRQRSHSIVERWPSQDVPRLANAHHEVISSVDEDQLVRLIELLAQGNRGRDPAKASTKNKRARHPSRVTAQIDPAVHSQRQNLWRCDNRAGIGRPWRSAQLLVRKHGLRLDHLEAHAPIPFGLGWK